MLLLAGACSGNSPVVGVTDQGSNSNDATDGEVVDPNSSTVTTFIDPLFFRLQDDSPLCMTRSLDLGPEGQPLCLVVSIDPADGQCGCDGPGKAPLEDEAKATLLRSDAFRYLCSNSGAADCSDWCLCEVLPASGDDLDSCLNADPPAPDAKGWCYIDPEQGIGSEALVDEFPCPRRLRAVGGVVDEIAGKALLACTATPGTVSPAPLGSACISSLEYDPKFSAFSAADAAADLNAPSCSSSVCLQNHVQGRASCPYGQTEEALAEEAQCRVPGSNEPVTTEVYPQLVARPASEHSICSCRCAGPGPGPFCECPETMQCEPMLDELGLPGEEAFAGSYCILKGTEYDPARVGGPVCSRTENNCSDR